MTRAVYAAKALNGGKTLFVTDGTAAGTVELTVTGASSLGLVASPSPIYRAWHKAADERL